MWVRAGLHRSKDDKGRFKGRFKILDGMNHPMEKSVKVLTIYGD